MKLGEQAMSVPAGVAQTFEHPVKVLVVSHNAQRAGAELFLLNVMRWINGNLPFEIQIVLARGGELETEFQALAPTWKIIGAHPSRADKIRLLLKQAILPFRRPDRGIFLSQAADLIRREFRPDVIYANTVMVAQIVARLAPLRVPVITHVHELDFTIRHRLGPERFSLLDRSTTHYIAVSSAVQENLQRAWGVSKDRVTVIQGFVPEATRNTDLDQKLSSAFRGELGIPGDAIVVGACGTQQVRKGTDFFLAVARELLNRKQRQDFRFVWLGGEPGQELYWWVKHDVERMGLGRHVQVLNVRKDTSSFFAAIDVFFLSSREDSFPLVCLEAASYAKPIVALAGAGGISEFTRNDAGVLTPYLDVVAAADAILKLAANPALRHAMGKVAKARAAANHSPEVGAQLIANVLQRTAEQHQA
jgi:glycosyltransferase involved in cell wall biosynthesis